MTITVYSKPACVQCNATYRALRKQGLDYRVIDITEDSESRDYVQSLGYLQAPVVVIDDDGRAVDHWSGYRPDKFRNLDRSAAA